jgi:hypothetical protein
MSKDVIVIDLVAELEGKPDFFSKRAAEERRLNGVIARNCDVSSATSDGDRAIIKVAKKKVVS